MVRVADSGGSFNSKHPRDSSGRFASKGGGSGRKKGMTAKQRRLERVLSFDKPKKKSTAKKASSSSSSTKSGTTSAASKAAAKKAAAVAQRAANNAKALAAAVNAGSAHDRAAYRKTHRPPAGYKYGAGNKLIAVGGQATANKVAALAAQTKRPRKATHRSHRPSRGHGRRVR